MRKIQNIYNCIHYTPNGNMNKTCRNEKRCCIFYEVYCKDFIEYKNIYNCKSCRDVIREPLNKRHLLGKHNRKLFITEQAFYLSSSNLVNEAREIYNIDLRIIFNEKGVLNDI